MASDTFEVLVKDASSTLMELPRNVQVTDGSWNGSEVETPVTITWAGSNDAAIRVYTVYRATRLNWNNGNDDQTSWTLVNTVERNTSGHTFIDTTIEAPGAYFYKINPTGAANLPTENIGSLDAFVKAAVLPPAPTVTVNTQSDESGIPLNWNSLDGASSYKVEVKGPTAASFSEAERTSSISFKYQTTVPGSFTFKVVPVVEFINKSDIIAEKFGPASEEKSGAVKLSDTAWIKLVMQTMMEGQKGFLNNDSTNGRYYTRFDNTSKTDETGKVKYSARVAWQTSNGNANNACFQAYNFTKFEDVNKSISVTGTLFHLYYQKDFCLTYSSSKWIENLNGADKTDKPAGTITVSGLYSGEIQIFGQNNVSEEFDNWDSALQKLIEPPYGVIGIVLSGDFPNWNTWSNLGKLKSNWGFELGTGTAPINTSTAYSIKRSGASGFTNYSYSQVGALQ